MSISGIDLNLLLVLDTVLRERSVAHAARRLHVTPSAISNGLAKLRVALGDPLVTRKGRGIVATPRALELAPALARALSELERAIAQPSFDAERCTRQFTLAMADAVQLASLPSLLAALAKSLPAARLRLVSIDSLLSLGNLASTEVDLQVGMRASGPGIHAEPLYDEPSVLAARTKHPECSGPVSRQRLAKLRHVGVELAPGRGLRDPVDASYQRAGVARQVALTVPSFAAAATVAANSDFVATLPLSSFVAQRRTLGLRAVTGPVPAHVVQLHLCWHERTHHDAGAFFFRDLVRGALRAGAQAALSASPPERRRARRTR